MDELKRLSEPIIDSFLDELVKIAKQAYMQGFKDCENQNESFEDGLDGDLSCMIREGLDRFIGDYEYLLKPFRNIRADGWVSVEEIADMIVESEDSIRLAIETQDRDYLEQIIGEGLPQPPKEVK